ncbi:hypothetical protein [Kitasatospora sp. NPDC088134]|uniref:hypothetical protein n=1 Tax=Kitasatospora sp. NPDC088134 TaxID=3364071 RepID=UPI003810C5D7
MGIMDLFRRKGLDEDFDPLGWDHHRMGMVKAAGIGVATLRCHRDTWAYFVDKFANKPMDRDAAAFRPPADEDITDEGEGMITVPLSGSTLAALLSKCRDLQFGAMASDLDKAIGRRVAAAIMQALRHVVPAEGDRSAAPAIVLDDRTAAPAAAAR